MGSGRAESATASWGSSEVLTIGTRLSFLESVAALGHTAISLRHRRWWTKSPFLPVPPREYFAWRMYTAYGEATARPLWGDIVEFALWQRRLERHRKVGEQ